MLEPPDVLLDLAANELRAPVTLHRNLSWAHGESTVLEVRDADQRRWIVKQTRDPAAFAREVHALTAWAPQLGAGRAPRIRVAVPERSLIVMDSLSGRAGAATTPAEFRQAGQLIRRLHDAEESSADPDYPARAPDNVARWVRRVPGVVGPPELDFVRARIATLESLPAPRNCPIHNDNQPRNWLTDADGTVRVIDFGKAKRDVQLRDFERMRHQEWRGRPDLREAFFDGYGRTLSEAEEQTLACIGAVAAVTTILWARAHNDEVFEQHGRQTLEHLREAANGAGEQ